MNANNRKLNVFLCHSSHDKPHVRKLYFRLLQEGWITPWFDEENLLPGQDWKAEIANAVRRTDIVIVCLSKDSINKEGFVQKEIKDALDIADKKPEGTIYIIPLKLEECLVPLRLQKWHWVDYTLNSGYEKLLKSLIIRYKSLNINIAFSDIEKPNSQKNKASRLQQDIFLQDEVASFEISPEGKLNGDDSLRNQLSPKVAEKKEYNLKKTFFYWIPIFITFISLASYFGMVPFFGFSSFWLMLLAYCFLIYYGFQNHISNKILWPSIFFGLLGFLSQMGIFALLPISGFWLLAIGFIILALSLLIKGI